MKPEWRHILELRSVKDKIAIPVDCELLDPGDLNIVAELVREGMMIWIDRTVLRQIALLNKHTGQTIIGIMCDVYQFTLKGIQLCNENGIMPR